MTDKPKVKRYNPQRTIDHYEGVMDADPDGNYVDYDDYEELEASRAADKARIAELYELLREARDIVEERRVVGENDDSLIYAIDASLAQQGKENTDGQ